MWSNIFAKLLQKLSLKKNSRKNPKPRNILEMLPPDLIVDIAQLLLVSSIALFALSCRSVCAILGTHHWTALRAEDQRQQHVDFLAQLFKEFPSDYTPCYHCRILHVNAVGYDNQVYPYGLRYGYCNTRCFKAEQRGEISEYIFPGFQFRTFQMAMKMHRL
jgi:hypothetical protein